MLKIMDGPLHVIISTALQMMHPDVPLDKITKPEPIRTPRKTYYRAPNRRNISAVDFYLHMTHHCVIGDNTLLLTFQLDVPDNQPDDVLLVRQCVLLLILEIAT